MIRAALLALLICLFFNLAFGQANNFPYNQSFEESFISGTNVNFLADWWANEVQSGSRISRKATDGRSGSAALAAEPTTTFTADIRLLLDMGSLQGASLSFWARSMKNGTGTRASRLFISFSADGGSTFTNPEEVGGSGAFPNADTAYRLFTFSLPPELAQNPQAVIRWQVRRSEEGTGTAARILLDEVAVEALNPHLQLLTAVANSAREVLLTFNMPLDEASAENTAHYQLNPATTITAANINPGNPRQVLLEVAPLSEGTYTLTASDILPASDGAPLQAASVNFTYTAVPQFRDLVINEIFADPNPKGRLQPQPVVLPTAADAEFVELFNTSATAYELQQLRLNGAKIGEFLLQPGAYVLLVPSGKGEAYSSYGPVAEVEGWKSLSNSGSRLQLTHIASNTLLDSLSYSLSWYQEAGKGEGGWSLEQINPYTRCSYAGNWKASSDRKGATPAAPNAVLDTTPDTSSPQLLQAIASEPQQLVLLFDEYLAPASVTDAQIALEPAVPVTLLQHGGKQVVVKLTEPLQEGTSYSLHLTGLADCSGNGVEVVAPVIRVKPAEAGEVVMNEIMYNPATDGAEWIELYNPTNQYLNLQHWYLGLREKKIKATAKLAEGLLLLPPKSFLLLSTKPAEVLELFPLIPLPSLLAVAGMPSLRNSGDTLVLLTPALEIAEVAPFSDKLHHPLLSDSKGVSLERISTNLSALNPANWTSAAAPAYGTPGRPNSQINSLAPAKAVLQIEPEVIEPMPDGVADIALIQYQLPGPGLSGTVFILDTKGREVNRLADNQLLGQEGTFQWNGTNSSGERVRNGYYIIVLSVFAADGYRQQWRKTIVVASWL